MNMMLIKSTGRMIMERKDTVILVCSFVSFCPRIIAS